MSEKKCITQDLLKNAAPIVFALIVCTGFFFTIYSMLNFEFPEKNKDALNQLLGVLITIFTLQMNFFFGASASSKAKDDTISDIAKSAPAAPISIPNAEAVSVKTEQGDVNLNQKEKV